eukprot:jgi/Tetstr1/459019/TSEL_004487.t1
MEVGDLDPEEKVEGFRAAQKSSEWRGPAKAPAGLAVTGLVSVGASAAGVRGHSGSGSGNNSAEQISVSKNGKDFGSGDGSGCGSGSVGGESPRTHGHEERNRQPFSSGEMQLCG